MNLFTLAFLGLCCMWLAVLAGCLAVLALAAYVRHRDAGGDLLEDWRRP